MRVSAVLLLGAIALAPIPCHAQFLTPSPADSGSAAAAAKDSLLQSLLTVKPQEIRFRPQDVISVAVYGLPAFATDQRVEANGTIRFPFVGSVQVAGRTVSELESDLETVLKRDVIVKHPQVTVTVVSQPWAIVTVSGDVMHPGVFPAFGGLTLMDYLSQAGGLQDNLPSASLITNSPASSVITLIRPSLGSAVTIPLGHDPTHSPWARIPMLPGDEIRVGRVGVVYAFGAFRSQGAFPLTNTGPTTVLQLAAMAGGIGFEGDRKDAHIIRSENGRRYVTDIDVHKILEGKMQDVALQAGDILFVPTKEMKAAIKGGGTGAIVTLGAAALYTKP